MTTLNKAALLALFPRRKQPPAAIFAIDPEGEVLSVESLLPVNLEEQILDPFKNSGLVDSPHTKEWVYLDDEGKLQGPFSTEEMDLWYAGGYLLPDRLVGLNSRDRLLPLWTFLRLVLFLEAPGAPRPAGQV